MNQDEEEETVIKQLKTNNVKHRKEHHTNTRFYQKKDNECDVSACETRTNGNEVVV
jgi:hypothetical protein